MNQSAPLADISLHTLSVFQAVAEAGSFTLAGQKCGLTQSAVTRQIQSLEELLEIRLFERTTRRVRLTDAGTALVERSHRILADVSHSLASFRESFADVPKRIRVGIAKSVGFAYLPGFFSAYQKKHPNVEIEFIYEDGEEILNRLHQAELDVGICCARRRLPGDLEVTHRFDDRFTGILPPNLSSGDLVEDFMARPFLALSERSETGRQLSHWRNSVFPGASPVMHSDSFDLIINLVSLGLGCAFVPIRALAIYGRRKPITRVAFPKSFSRELIVVFRRDQSRPTYLQDFVSSVPF